jgi:hypothetical protein
MAVYSVIIMNDRIPEAWLYSEWLIDCGMNEIWFRPDYRQLEWQIRSWDRSYKSSAGARGKLSLATIGGGIKRRKMAGNLSVDDRWRKDAMMAAGKANEYQPTSPEEDVFTVTRKEEKKVTERE